MNGYLARVTRCTGTTSEEGGSYSSNDIVCAGREATIVTSAATTTDSMRIVLSSMQLLQENAFAILRRGPRHRTRRPCVYCKKLVGLPRAQRAGRLVRRMMSGHPAYLPGGYAMRSLASLLIAPVILSATLPVDGLAQQAVDIREWTVPWADSRPRDPYVDSKGRVWFVGQTADYVAMLDPETGQFTKYDLDKGAGPHNLIVDNKGVVWYAGNRAMHIGRLDPTTKAIQKIMMPDSGARDPHTLVFDSKGDIWFTVQGGGYVGRLTVADGSVKLVKIPGSRTRPYGIVVDPQGHPWFNEFGTNKIGTVDPATMTLREYELSNT